MDNRSNKDEKPDNFELIMEKAGTYGSFQRIFNGIFVLGISFCGALVYMNIYLVLTIPEHWCHVPGINSTNFTVNEWRAITLPKQIDNRGQEKYSSCNMYNESFSNFSSEDFQNWNGTVNDVISCSRGYEYDQTWYEATIPTTENWVCDKEIYVTQTFVLTRIVEVIGSFILGQMGDTYGRRIVYYFSVIVVTFGRGFSILATSSMNVFVIATALAAFPGNSLFQSPVIIAMEISNEDERASIALYNSLGFSIATSFMPLVYWWLRHWIPFMWLTTVPTAFILIFYKYMIESPRWLISKKRFGEALTQLKKIAKINGKDFHMTENEIEELYKHQKQEKVLGMVSLFSQWRIARNTIIIGLNWSVVTISYFTLVLLSSRMDGNPFINFFLQNFVEIPAYFVGKYLADRFGRRITNSMSFLVLGLTCIPLILIARDEKYWMVATILVAFIRFLNGNLFFVERLQALEIYPTCVRLSGISLTTILGNAVSVVAPYIVYLGTTYDTRYPYYILFVFFAIAGVSSVFLPESLHMKLPDTLEDAHVFGKDQKFFSLPKAVAHIDDNNLETEKLNAKKYAP